MSAGPPGVATGASALRRLMHVVAGVGVSVLVHGESQGLAGDRWRPPIPLGQGQSETRSSRRRGVGSESRPGHKHPPGRCCGQRPALGGGQDGRGGPWGFPKLHVAGGKLRPCRGGQALEREGRGRGRTDGWEQASRRGHPVGAGSSGRQRRTWLVDVPGKPVRCLGLIVSLPHPRQRWPACLFLPFPTR